MLIEEGFFSDALLHFLDRWVLWLFPAELQVLLCGLLELSNGCVRLSEVSIQGLRFVLSGTVLAFGGFCVAMQVASAAGTLSMARYLPLKLLQTALCFLLCCSTQIFLPPEGRWHCPPALWCPVLMITALMALKLKRSKKIGSIPALSDV